MPQTEYENAADLTEQLESELVEKIGGETTVGRRTVLGALGVAGSAAVGIGSSNVGAATGHDESDHGNFGAVDEQRNDAAPLDSRLS